MDVASLKAHSYLLTNSNAGTFLGGDANVLPALNICYGHRILDILKISVDPNASMHEVTTTHLSTVGLIAGQIGYNGEYPFPTDLLKPKRVEVSYDGVTWRLTTVYDGGENQGSEFNQSQIVGEFNELDPKVDFIRDSMKIRPPKTTAGNISQGIYIEYEQRQVDLTTGSPTFEPNLHDILAYDLCSLEYLRNPGKYAAGWHGMGWKSAFDQEKAKSEMRFMEYYKNRFKRNKKIEPNFGGNNLSYN